MEFLYLGLVSRGNHKVIHREQQMKRTETGNWVSKMRSLNFASRANPREKKNIISKKDDLLVGSEVPEREKFVNVIEFV